MADTEREDQRQRLQVLDPALLDPGPEERERDLLDGDQLVLALCPAARAGAVGGRVGGQEEVEA